MRVRAGHGFNNGGSAKNGIVAHNKLYNANAAHWFDDIKQVILSNNQYYNDSL